ncbi:phosphomethylpyrimidine kinase [Caldisphaera lagunensis DSM 15908]|uniref:Phosphomethylpyrimidine kinase n=1 Tax=Caldisphaera lagunensis (strain DSM 15908 / JCM 11604 / ANMR 0165 / IC-154) TaxID=1056495 RepID=L0A9N7_CALLD|nr:bifunctional hydroxymethylpyrimidine kinase/phosphomethylpyrimidine kinase [Caldisphaera lagunensis]AFZ70598.1 phosphomethylpyrimidine kinase [Caldisphaera lagunensis DSM 15908]
MNKYKQIPVALTIAGSDSGGGAGIAADLKTFASLGVHGTVAITSVTAQNTYEVTGIYDVTPDMVRKQIEAVYNDFGIDAAKTGMLSNALIVEEVANTLKSYDFPLVIDPVMVSKSCAPLLREDAVNILIKKLIPRATVITPNIPEAEKITNMKILNLDDARKAAKIIVEEFGAKAAIVKGGHMKGEESIDVLYYNGEFREFVGKRINTKSDHGTGCSFSASITANLAKGYGIVESIKIAKELISNAIFYGLPLGKGHGPVNPISYMEIPYHKYMVYIEMKNALKLLDEKQELIAKLIPEISTNLAMALPRFYARSIDDVIAVPGRIRKFKDKLIFAKEPEFGASDHVARALLKFMDYFPEYRSAANIAYNDDIKRIIEKLNFSYSYYDRKYEPKDVKEKEGGSMQWGIEFAIKNMSIKNMSNPLDIIIDYGDFGKEPGAIIFGKTANEVVGKMIKIAELL